ncbi:MAG: hypothetical protein KIT11_00775 [Fimbriimonadaceae bacterium]|nr:hypothetical protein [Fimbriimonadaceae bacterium]QYK55093.1 MAG: hypothetical protein KF733_08760 [Fimbriimonadaceae bacterium]
MSETALWIARRVWWAMLWFMRRPWMKRVQRASINLWPEGAKRESARASFRRQERLARQIGLRVLHGVFTLCLYFVALVVIYSLLSEVIGPELRFGNR